jgi:hypothetical protein
MDILPKESYILVFENNGEAVFVRIECDKDFVSEIEKRMGV